MEANQTKLAKPKLAMSLKCCSKLASMVPTLVSTSVGSSASECFQEAYVSSAYEEINKSDPSHASHSIKQAGLIDSGTRCFAWAAASVFLLLGGIDSGFGGQATPLKIVKVTPSGQNVVVSWQGGNGPYQLLSRTNLSGEWRKVGSPTSGYIVTNPSLSTPACFYRITTDLTAPGTPGGLTITTNTDETQLVLRWNAVADNSGGAGMKGYNIYRNNLFIKRVLPTATTTITTIDTGLTPDTAYAYTVSAEDLVANESAKSTSVSARTPRKNCTYALSLSSAYPGAASGNGTFTVTTGNSCSWSPVSSAPGWLTCSPSSFTGSGTVTWYVTANTSTSSRYGTLTIGAQTFSVTQAGATPTCTYALSSSSAYPGAAPSSGTFTVTAGTTCSWSPVSSAPSWLTFTPASWTGSGTVTWYVTTNTSTSSRYGTLTIAGQTFSVTQAGAPLTCTYERPDPKKPTDSARSRWGLELRKQ